LALDRALIADFAFAIREVYRGAWRRGIFVNHAGLERSQRI
jgi:hypothetical protein